MGLRRFYWQHIASSYPVRVRGERFVGDPRFRVYWKIIKNEKANSGLLDILDSRLRTDDIMWDIGGHVGQVALYASRKCRHVLCFEPDPVALESLYWHIDRNKVKNITVINSALMERTGFVEMGSFWDSEGLGQSVTSSRPAPGTNIVKVPGLGPGAWGEWLRGAPPSLIKMDIEGGEFDLLPAMGEWLRENRPKLLLSFHAGPLREAGRMSTDEAREALEKCTSALSSYGEFTDLFSGEKLPLSKLTSLQMDEDWDKLLAGVFLE